MEQFFIDGKFLSRRETILETKLKKNHLIWHHHKWPDKRNNINIWSSRMSFDVMHNLLLKTTSSTMLFSISCYESWWNTANKRRVFCVIFDVLLHRLRQIFAQRMRLCTSKAQAKQINQKSEGFECRWSWFQRSEGFAFFISTRTSWKFRIDIAQVQFNRPETLQRNRLRQNVLPVLLNYINLLSILLIWWWIEAPEQRWCERRSALEIR